MRNVNNPSWPAVLLQPAGLFGLVLGVLLAAFVLTPVVAGGVSISFASSDTDADSPDTTAERTEGWESNGRDVVRMGEDIEIGPGETIEGDVVAMGGKVTVLGHVKGDVVSIGGGITLRTGAVVDGDAVCVGGSLEREEGVTVGGQNVSVGVLPKGILRFITQCRVNQGHHDEGGPVKALEDFFRYLAFFVVSMILCLAFPKRTMAIRSTLRSRFWLSLLISVPAVIAIAIAAILLCVTCVGILVAVPGIFVVILLIFGSAAIGMGLLGEAILKRPVVDSRSWLLSFVVGLGILFVISALGRLLLGGEGLAHYMGRSLMVICGVAWTGFMMAGLGSLVLSRLGERSVVSPPTPWTDAPGTPTTPAAPTA